MKKIYGIIFIVLCSFFLLSFLFFVIIMNIEPSNLNKEVLSVPLIISISVLFGLCAYGFRYGIKCLQKEKPPIVIEYDKILNINILGQISFSDYRKMSLELLLNKKSTYFLIFFFLFYIVLLAESFYNSNEHQLLIYCVIPFLFLLYFFVVFYQLKRASKNKLFTEKLTIKITNEEFGFNGETFNSTMLWNRYYKLKETKRFFLLYQDNIIVNIIQKNWLSETELTEFRKFLYSLNIPKELYKIKIC